MSESIQITKGAEKAILYDELLPQIHGVLQSETDLIANLANVSAILKEAFQFFWVGFYLVQGEELVLGPFQGSLACTRIKKGRGVCGKSWETRQIILVPDVNLFPGHIACSSLSRSEMVVPIFKNNEVVGVLDVDSDQLDDFNQTDAHYLEKLAVMIGQTLK
ncbi:MAG TPA: GAF domain-containing protein [Bacteroidales bacterium]|nr:GAF domain-containing protein [Bacteroidales bacterium]